MAKWLTRIGFSASDIRIVISGMTYTMYVKQNNTQYGRIMFEVLSESSINGKSSNITLYDSNAPESTEPTATVTSSDGATVASANKLTTARTVQTNLGSTSTASFDGSANIAPGVTGTLPIANGGTGATTADAALTNLGITATATELNYVDGVTSNIQTQLNGKASSSHGTHVTWSTTTPKVNGTAAVGSETKVSRGDHVHPTDTSRASQTDLAALETVVAGKASSSHTHNYAGSSSVGGDAINSDKLDGYHADNFPLIYSNYGANYFNSMDLDTWTRAGHYAIQSGCTNTPSERGEDAWGTIFVVKGLSDRISQFAIFWNEAGNPLWHRCKNSSTWSTWKKVQDGGVALNSDKLDGYHANDFVFLQNFIAGKLGSTIAYYSTSANKDCNSIEEFVSLAGGADGLHYPTANNYYYIFTLRYADTAKKQIAFGYKGTVADNIVFRTCNDGTWTGWKQLYTSANITYGTSELTAGSSSLATGNIYFQYE
jgi:hypothetical protein